MKLLLTLSLIVFAVACARGSYRAGATPPETRSTPVADALHGREVVDPYRWLEGDNTDPVRMGRVTPDVAAWTDAQNDYTRGILDQWPGRSALEAAMRPLMEVGAVTAPSMRASRYFYSRREGAENQPRIFWREGHAGEDRLLIDPATIDASGLTTVEWVSPSPDGRLLAYGTYRAGDENTALRLLDVDTGAVRLLEIPNRTQPAQWLPDSFGFLYQNLRDPKDPYSGRVKFHRLGTDPADDLEIVRQFTRAENEALATTWGPFGSLSHDGRWLLLGYWVDTASNDLWLVDFEAVRRTGRVVRRDVTTGVPGLASGTVVDGTLYLHTTKGAPKGRVVAVDTANPRQSHWRDLVAERDDAVIESVSFAAGRIAVTYLKDASNETELFDLSGASRGRLRQPGIGSTSLSTEEDRTEAFLTFTSFNHPTTIFRVDLAEPGAEPALWAKPDVPVDPSTVAVEQVWYPSKDGTRISMFVVHRKGLEKNGALPTLVTGYGGFNVSMTPAFSPTWFQWFEAGGVYAVPNLRGGGEYGDEWHQAGMLDRKQNVFDDFIAAAEWLVANGYTNPSRLAIAGGSNGGLLTGAALTQRPDLFRAAIVAVPLLDMLRYQDFLMARYWVPEYGTAENSEHFPFLREYSPYHQVRSGTAYPAVFLTAGENDTRVHAMHARKMTALLQAATTSDPAEQPVLLWVDRDAGHGQGKPLNLRLRDAVDQRAFLMWQLGMDR
ncbi:MAG TPA: prolyl oligopeptidase family serine peptidase [Vicinamibacterales bacterium]|nr:prolyl oligopeptidase family serine peptidase [Vicinamibacterales bacterium]